MRRLGTWKWQLAVVAGLSGAAVWGAAREGESAKPKPDQEEKPGWFGRWFNREAPAPEPAPAPTVATKPPMIEQAAEQRRREEENLWRRLAVCDELTKIALETQDEELGRLATQLMERATATYTERVANLPATGRFVSDEETLEKYLGAGAAANPRQTGSPPYSHRRPQDRRVETAAWEDK